MVAPAIPSSRRPSPGEMQAVLGNQAIGRAAVESGISVATAYPGNPSSEILASIIQNKHRYHLDIHTEWSVNEKVAFEVAFTTALLGKRAVVSMKMVGLNVAADALMSAAYQGVRGGLVVIGCDDPGPHSSQTEQDTRFLAMFAKLPVLDPGDPLEAQEMVRYGFELSEQFEVPVIVRPTVRVSHARQSIVLREIQLQKTPAPFVRDPARWASLPPQRLLQHHGLNEKIERIREVNESSPFNVASGATAGRLAVLATGVAASHLSDVLDDLGGAERLGIGILKVGTPYPLPYRRVKEYISHFDQVLCLEESDPVIELQLDNRERVVGRLTGHVPGAGELTPDTIFRTVGRVAREFGIDWPGDVSTPPVRIPNLPLKLCAGCGHQPAFHAIREAFPEAFYASDIGCYSLGVGTGAVDTILCMGASISQASGYYWATKDQPDRPPIVATIGDSTFFHAGVPPLVNAVHTGARFILVVLDNSTTAMTGNQEHPGTDFMVEGEPGRRISIRGLIEACGVPFVREVQGFDWSTSLMTLWEADAFTRSPEGGVAAIIAHGPCVMVHRIEPLPVRIEEDRCITCRRCTTLFNCPALTHAEFAKAPQIDYNLCVDCGMCVFTCPTGAIKLTQGEA